MESMVFYSCFAAKLFCHLQQTVKGLLFFRLLDQLCKERTEHIGAVLPQCGGNFVDAVVQLLDRFIGGFGFGKQVGQVADEGIGGIIVDDLVGFLDDLLVIFGGSYRPFSSHTSRDEVRPFRKVAKSRRSMGDLFFGIHWLSSAFNFSVH